MELMFKFLLVCFNFRLNYGLSGGSDGKESTCNAGNSRDMGLIPELGRSPARGKWRPTPVFLPGKFHGQRSLAGYSPWGHQESDTTEQVGMKMNEGWCKNGIHAETTWLCRKHNRTRSEC